MTFNMRLRKIQTAGRAFQKMAKRRLLIETLCDRRVLAAISGVVFDDLSGDWRLGDNETPLAQRLVFMDANDNGLPDDGERFVLTDDQGAFAFDELGDDEQIVRLFSGAPSQFNLFPIVPGVGREIVDLTQWISGDSSLGGLRLAPDGDHALVQAGPGLVVVDLAENASMGVDFGAMPRGLTALPDGRFLVLASDSLGNHSFLLAVDGTVLPVDLAATAGDGEAQPVGDGEPSADPDAFLGWASVAIDSGGNGFILPAASDESSVWLHRIAAGETLATIGTAAEVAADSRLISGGALTTLVAQPVEDGLSLSLWSNSTGTMIDGGTATVSGLSEVIAYSDDSGLVFAWIADDEVSAGAAADQTSDPTGPTLAVLDAAAGFATLQTLTGLGDLVAVDTGRSVIFSLNRDDRVVRVIDAVTAEILTHWSLPDSPDFATDQSPIEMAVAAGGDELLMLVPGAIATLSLTRFDAHRVRAGVTSDGNRLRFAVSVDGENQPPTFDGPLEFRIAAGTPFRLPEGGLIASASDVDGDPFVILRNSSPASGSVVITPGGAMTYLPDLGFVGNDSFEVFLHDGRGASEMTTVNITVLPSDGGGPEVVVNLLPVPENVEPGFVVGTIQTIGFGGGVIKFVIDDPRFRVVDDWIIVAPEAGLNYEDEFLILTNVIATNEDTGISVTQALRIEVTDKEDPIEDILPRSASVLENVAGELIAELMVVNQDSDALFSLSVDDPRFEIVNRSLRLRPGISLDYEASSEVTILITATDVLGSRQPLTVPFTLAVIDVLEPKEPVGTISLAGSTVMEYIRGMAVGLVHISGKPANSGISISVDDSRFEIVDGILKLREGQFLTRADQQEAVVVLTAVDTNGELAPVSTKFVITVMGNQNPFHNPDSPYDVDGDGIVKPLDAILVINAISRNRGGGPISQFPASGGYWDVNGDGKITPLDALLIINFINRQNRTPMASSPEAMPEPESPQVPEANRESLSPSMEASPEEASPTEASSTEDVVEASWLRDAATGLPTAKSDAVENPLVNRVTEFDSESLATELAARLAASGIDAEQFRKSMRLEFSGDELSPKGQELLERLGNALRRGRLVGVTTDAIDRALESLEADSDASDIANRGE